jgi:acetyl-CoA synthetase
MVARDMGKPLRPKAIHFVPDLPKTRNAKILRRVVKAVYLGLAPGDLTALENPQSLEAIGAAGGVDLAEAGRARPTGGDVPPSNTRP